MEDWESLLSVGDHKLRFPALQCCYLEIEGDFQLRQRTGVFNDVSK